MNNEKYLSFLLDSLHIFYDYYPTEEQLEKYTNELLKNFDKDGRKDRPHDSRQNYHRYRQRRNAPQLRTHFYRNGRCNGLGQQGKHHLFIQTKDAAQYNDAEKGCCASNNAASQHRNEIRDQCPPLLINLVGQHRCHRR